MNISLSNMVLDNRGPLAGGGCGSSGGAPGGGGVEFIRRKKPDWLRAPLPGGKGYAQTRGLVDKYALHTVCESAKCPNLGECWARGTATMMILGDVCTRACGFCHIKTGRPPEYDLDEPRRVGEAAALMRLKHIVITSVNRDELPDGGAEIWAETIREIRRHSPGTSIEVLIPDFCGNWDALQLVLDERPEILNHNMETVRRMYKVVRPQALYDRSIELLRRAKAQGLTVKTGIMVGIGERPEEIEQLIRDVTEGTRTPGINHDNPATNRDPFATPDPNRHLPPGGRLERSVTGVEKPALGDKLRRGGHLVSQTTNPYWRHSQPCPPPDMSARIAQVSFPHATYPSPGITPGTKPGDGHPPALSDLGRVHESCDILTIGQYLQPTRDHLPISRWVTPAEFVEYKRLAEAIGFRHCESGPLVRSSYHADEQVLKMEAAPAGV